jgi:hypothetical protein
LRDDAKEVHFFANQRCEVFPIWSKTGEAQHYRA